MKINSYYNYEQYLALNTTLVNDSEVAARLYDVSKHEYFLLNQRRMERIDKTIRLSEEYVSQLRCAEDQTWVVISEPWCGDSAQILPALAAMAAASDRRISLKIVLRDVEEKWIEKYPTNGSKSIPKLISFKGHSEEVEQELFQWGPRPAGAVEVYKAWKSEENPRPKPEFEKDLHTWYAHDKTISVQHEIMELLAAKITT
jgi:hypothetical protein